MNFCFLPIVTSKSQRNHHHLPKPQQLLSWMSSWPTCVTCRPRWAQSLWQILQVYLFGAQLCAMYLSGHKRYYDPGTDLKELSVCLVKWGKSLCHVYRIKDRWFIEICGANIRNVGQSRRFHQRWAWVWDRLWRMESVWTQRDERGGPSSWSEPWGHWLLMLDKVRQDC